MEWTELDSLNEFGEVDQFTAGKVYGLKFRLSPANGGLFSKKFEATVNGKKVEYHGDDITNGGVFYTEIEALEKIVGDLNNDGMVNVTDLSLLAAHIKGRRKLPDPTAANLNSDGKTDITDLSKLAAHIKGKRLLIVPEYTDLTDIPD
ncbi:MAG: dockerin type I repeat-containing protein [Ruminococcus sp.]|nr:dockerin type I repeat-containing protein [Ruminococcus sp.]